MDEQLREVEYLDFSSKVTNFKDNTVKYFAKVFAWYILAVVLVIGIIFSLSPEISVVVTSKTFIINSVVFIVCNIIVFFSFLGDGVNTALKTDSFIGIKTRYKTSKGTITRIECNKALKVLNEQNKVNFISYATGLLGMGIEEIKEINLKKKNVYIQYSKHSRKIIKGIQTQNYESPYPDNCEWLFYADGNEMRRKIEPNGHLKYIAFISTRKIVISIIMSLGACALVINSLKEQSVFNIIITIFFFLLTMGMSVFAGFDGGQKSIHNHKSRFINYCSDIFDEIREWENNGKP